MYRAIEKINEIQKKISEAIDAPFSGWDFSYAHKYGRQLVFPLSWDYKKLVSGRAKSSTKMLDMGTGGGEFLSSLYTRPKEVYATESYPPNVQVAKERLSPLGIEVIEISEGKQENYPLPFDDEFFDLIINRHECYDSKEIYRILRPNGFFITQQVGERNFEKLRTIFGILGQNENLFDWNVENAQKHLESAGFTVLQSNESMANSRFYDLRSIVYYLKAISWDFPDFSPEADKTRLENVALLIDRDKYFEDIWHRFLLIAQK